MDPGLSKLITLPSATGLREHMALAWPGEHAGRKNAAAALRQENCRPLELASPALSPLTAVSDAEALRVQIQN